MPDISTAEVNARRTLDMSCGQECVDWAIGLLLTDQDTPHVRQLAGMSSPFDHWELARLRDRALEELGEKPIPRDSALEVLARERLRLGLAGKADLLREVGSLARLCIEHGFAREVFDFYLLACAYDTLVDGYEQWDWPGATRANIVGIIRERAEEFVRGH